MNASFYLIRTKKNQILGPVVKEDLVKRVQAGELDPLDEICPASGYWVFLHEREEVKKLIGAELPVKKRAKDEDDTHTDTETETATATATGDQRLPPVVHPERKSAPAPSQSQDYHVERTGMMKFLLYVFMGMLIFVLFRIYRITQS